jgi:SAM-dependent methyltransferase
VEPLAADADPAHPESDGPSSDPPTRLLCDRCGTAIAIPSEHIGAPTCAACGRSYQWIDGVLSTGAEADEADYPDEGFHLLVESEQRHFWFEARNRTILAAMRDFVGPISGRSVLDVGCGTGYVLAALERAGLSVTGLDMHLAALRHARGRTKAFLLHDRTRGRLPFEPRFDLVTLCDVIEHVADDAGLLRAAASVVRPGGAVLVTVPADQRLWSVLDEKSGHKRRYTRATLAGAVSRAGLELVGARYFNTLLYPVQLVQRWLALGHGRGLTREELFGRAVRPPPAPLNTLFGLVSRAEGPLVRRGMPFGASLVAVARTPPQGRRV